MDIDFKQKFSLIVISLIGNLIILLILYTLLAQITLEFANQTDFSLLFLIVMSLFTLNMVIPVFISIITISDPKLKIVSIKSAIFTFIIILFSVIFISYLSLLIGYPSIFDKLQGLDILFSFPQLIFLFSIYFFTNPFYFFIIVSFCYYIIFTINLEVL